ncbi:WPP domain-interacting protein 1 [Hirschfeldia incana]|nr:WPP domain-interacting protein 1 [Hirschfeldia incana]
MDLESESSALESIGDNGLIQQTSINTADDDNNGKSLDQGSFSDDSVKLVSTTSGDNETSVKALSFGSQSPVLSKGRGLRKWRRIRRDLVKDTSGNMENSKVLKRGLSGSAAAHSHGNKQMLFQSLETEQESQGSVGSVNMLKSDGFEMLRSGFDDARFMAGIGFSAGVVGLGKDDDRSSKSSTPVIVSSGGQRGKGRVENSKKHRGESVEKENSHSSLESDSRKPSGSLIMNHKGMVGDEADMNGETSKRNDDAEGEESINNNNGFSEELDPLTEAIDGFLTLQEALEKEVQQYRDIGKETMPEHHEGASEVSSPGSEIVSLVNTVEQLEIKLEETKSMLEVKESHIRELESTTNQNKRSLGGTRNVYGGTETVVEEIFRQKIEAEIEYLIYSRSIDKLVEAQEALAEEQANETLNKLDKVQTKAASLRNRAQDLQNGGIETSGSIRKRACKITSCFLIQLVLLLTVALVFMSQLVPESSDIVVVPT